MNPNDGEILAMASAPTFKPSVFVGRTDPKKLAPLLDPTVAKKDNYPGLDRATAGAVPAGLDVQAGDGARGDGGAAPLAVPADPVHAGLRRQGRDGKVTQVFNNWDPYANEPMTLPQALGASCDTYFYNLGLRLLRLPADRGQPLQDWASRFGFGETTGIDIGAEQAGLLPTPDWRQARRTRRRPIPSYWQIDRLWKPGDSIQLAIGQKDLLVTPLQMTRFYALIANGGKLVTPARRRSRRGARQPEPAPAGAPQLNPPSPTASCLKDPAALDGRPGRPLRGHPRLIRHGDRRCSAASRSRSPARREPPRRSCSPPDTEAAAQDQSWWCGYGPPTRRSPTLVVCVVIENGGHGGTAAAPAALKVFEQYFHEKAPAIGTDLLRLMADVVDRSEPRARARARRRELDAGRAARAGSTGSCCSPSPALVAYGLWAIAGITRDDILGDPSYYVHRQVVFVAVGVVGARRSAVSSTRTSTAATWRQLYVGTLVLLAARASSPATVARGSRRWIDLGFFRFQPSEFGKLLIVLALAGLPRRPRQADRRAAHRACGDRARRAADAARLHPAGHRHGARLRAPGSRAVLFVAGTRWPHLGRRLRRRRRSMVTAVLWLLPAAGVHVLKPYQAQRLTGFLAPGTGSDAARPTTSTSR